VFFTVLKIVDLKVIQRELKVEECDATKA